ncbi:MAG TPA: 30S ribosomal protein S2 [Candidatus Veblenbacteria bacterium]|uniref:Small ribosomal subunit protein uS2 n=2 Tax=Candidatus Vebleniibacteriota TaxID=1817921 RepID=A0A1G2Q3J5_9BACT|nr:MAG: 30S ribosomal protein S2 [Parcubacteria group bacterium GW2011_GWA1_43_27]KKT22501.1 MAG: 30S ribosomal protein S2 [Parcubacteria group bacterium GW2011_GWE1_43_8]OHA55165.1 MAG: 30S ribosomal protein S2 [Candidatus Veblenbacteria bacterium RIFOXYC1_FULL_42_9]HBH17147.1 30S ribosomal protein S2 [Candidatus Veblenbacteria bacterium]HBZ36297.1 30S ribosomal protein S2 [Candidatus Veblenbacteria bacterium]
MPEIPSLVEMLKAGMHFGHQTSKWHPKMRQYIYSSRQGIHILDLEKTAVELTRALTFIKELVAAGGLILFTSLKKQADEVVRQAAEDTGMPYIVERWLGGVFTNWGVISKLIQRFEKLEADKTRGTWNLYTKKEQIELEKDLDRLRLTVGGIRTMTKLPEAVFIVGVREGKNAIREANKVKVPVIGMVDTDTNPKMVQYIIPGNDDALKSIKLVVDLVTIAIKEGQSKAESAKIK